MTYGDPDQTGIVRGSFTIYVRTHEGRRLPVYPFQLENNPFVIETYIPTN